MTVLIGFLLWYGLGAIGSYLVCEFFYRRNADMSIDIDVGTLIFSGFMALLGPLNLIVGIISFIAWAFRTYFNIDYGKVIFKKYDKDD